MTRIYTKNKEIPQFFGSKKLKELPKKRPGSNRGFWICFCHGVTSLCCKLHIVLFLGIAYVFTYSAIWVWWWRPRDFTFFKWCSQTNDCPQENLAKFGCRPNIKSLKKTIFSVFDYLFQPVVKIWWLKFLFLKKNREILPQKMKRHVYVKACMSCINCILDCKTNIEPNGWGGPYQHKVPLGTNFIAMNFARHIKH